jgi:restriction endonuclease S subunit/predicted ATPase
MPDTLPKGWTKTKLGEVCLPVATVQPGDSPDIEFTYFDIGGIDNYRNRIAETKTVTGRNAPSRARQALRTDDILFSTVRTYLRKIARVEHEYPNPVASTGFAVIRPANGVSSQFLFAQLLSDDFLEPLHKLQTGTSYPAVRARDVLSQPILLPPTNEQVRIVTKLNSALSAVQRAESAAIRAIERLHRYRAAIMNAAVSGELTRDWRAEQEKNKAKGTETGDAVLQRLLDMRRTRWEEMKDGNFREKGHSPRNDHWKSQYSEPCAPIVTDMPDLPETWAWASLEMIAEIGSGISVSQNRRVENPIELPYLRVANVLRGFLDLREMKTIRVEKDRAAEYFLHVGDILFTEGGDRDKLGRGWIWEGQIKRCVHQNHVFRARPFDPLLVRPNLVSYWGNTFGQRFFLKHGKQTTNLASINRGVLARLPVPIAPTEEQTEILRQVEHRLAAADKLATTLEKQLTRARAMRQSLLRDALRGSLVPQDLNDESAAALLEHIRQEKVQSGSQQKQRRREIPRTEQKRSDPMQEPVPSTESLRIAWEKIGRKTDARRLFDETGLSPEQVVQFYEALRATPDLRTAFVQAARKHHQKQRPAVAAGEPHEIPGGRFRLVELWLEDFKNLRDYSVHFNPTQGLDVVLGWNGTGKSNLFEALVIIFRDLHEWWEKNRWPDKPMNGYRLSYEMDEHVVEIMWRPAQMKRPELKRGPIPRKAKGEVELNTIRREQLPLPRFVFGYYSGPTNRLAEHFLPMKQDHYDRLRLAKADDAKTLAKLLEQRRFFCAETHHAKYVLLGFSYKEDKKISEFLENRLRIVGFESALFIIRKPLWAKSGSRAEDFWGATGIMRRVMERLRRYAIAPMELQQKVNYGYRSTTEDHYYFFLPDLESLHSFAAEYQDARTFFLALESTDFSELIHDVKIQVRVKSTNTHQVSITFHQLSEGEQQLLMVLGLMRFTKSHQSLVLLDEPDTHLNPHWSVGYIKDLAQVMSDNAIESAEQQTSQILMATHDPLVIASLLKEQIHLLKRDTQTGACKWEPASVNPRGLGFTGILTSEMFGFRSDLDPETLGDLDNRVRLIAKEEALTPLQKKELEDIDKRLAAAGFSKAFSDPYYAAFVRAWGRRHSQLMAGQQFLTPDKRQEIDRIASEVLKEAVAEVDKGAGN